MLKIVNRLPYDMHVYETNSIAQGPMFTYPKTDRVARVLTVEHGSVHGPTLWYQDVEYLGLEEFPDPESSTFYIVSLVAALAGRDRGDLLVPYHKIRDSSKLIIGCKSLQRVC